MTLMNMSLQVRQRHLEIMLYARQVEQQITTLYRQGRISGSAYLGRGQEAFSAAAGVQLQSGDILAPLTRDCAARIAFGESLTEIFRTYLGKATGIMRGRDGNTHRGHIRTGILPMISHLGGMIAPVAGILLSRRLQGQDKLANGDLHIGMASIGDGGMSTGALHEGLNAAAVLHLPLVLLVSDNHYAYSTPSTHNYACQHLADRAVGYGIQSHQCDGNDSDACLHTLYLAVQAARQGQGSQMVVASIDRLCGHSEHDDARYIPPSVQETRKDCVELRLEQLQLSGDFSASELSALQQRIDNDIQQTLQQVSKEPEPDAQQTQWQALSHPEQLWQ